MLSVAYVVSLGFLIFVDLSLNGSFCSVLTWVC